MKMEMEINMEIDMEIGIPSEGVVVNIIGKEIWKCKWK